MKRILLGTLLVLPTATLPASAADAAAPHPAAHASMPAHNSNAPINVSSDTFEGNFQTKVGTYSGNVIVSQGDDKLRADQVKVDVVAGKPSRFEANGHVVFVSSSGLSSETHVFAALRLASLASTSFVFHGVTFVENAITLNQHFFESCCSIAARSSAFT